jgi:rod shape-determining protein MreB
MWQRLFPKVGLDLGSRRTRLWLNAIVFDQPSCVVFDQKRRSVVAIGTEAVLMERRVEDRYQVVWPIQEGEVVDEEALAELLRYALRSVGIHPVLVQPTVLVATAASASDISRYVIAQVLRRIGAAQVFTLSQPVAAAIGAGVPIADASGSFMLHLGAGVVEAGVISLGSLVHVRTSYRAGSWLEQMIRLRLLEAEELEIALESAQKLLAEIATARVVNQKTGAEQLVMGQDRAHQRPRELSVSSALILPTVTAVLQQYTELVRTLLARLPPELTTDVIDKGLLLSGGLAALQGIDSYFVRTLGVPVSVVDEPDTAVIRGLGTTLEHLDEYRQSLTFYTEENRTGM